MASLAANRILMVEDSPGDVYLVERLLYEAKQDKNYDIIDVPRLVDAFRLLDRESFDAILLDLNLLDIDGVSSVAALHAEVPNTPIIIYSGMEDKGLKEMALLCGASEYLVKGHVDGRHLRLAIDHHIPYPIM